MTYCADVTKVPTIPQFSVHSMIAYDSPFGFKRLRDWMWDANREVPAAVDAINQIADGLSAEVHLHSCHSGGVQRLGVERVALNPDCGFAPDAGEPPTIDEAYQKLCRLTEVAQRLRGELLCG